MAGLADIARLGVPAAGALAAITGSKDAEASFGGLSAQMADKMMYSIARKMESEGMTPEQIFQHTRFYKGADDKWRFEMDDTKSAIMDTWAEDIGIGGKGKLADYFNSPSIFANYPALEDVKLSVETNPRLYGSFNPATRNLTLRPGMDPRESIKTVLHELQHGIQEAEDFARGGSTQLFDEVVVPNKNNTLDIKRLNYEIDYILGELSSLKRSHSDALASGNTALADQIEEEFTGLRQMQRNLQQQLAKLQNEPAYEFHSPYDQYKSLYGEAEARNVERRWEEQMRYKKHKRHNPNSDFPDPQGDFPEHTMLEDVKQTDANDLYINPEQAPGYKYKKNIASAMKALNSMPSSASAMPGLFGRGAAFLADSLRDAQQYAEGPQGNWMQQLLIPGPAATNLLDKWSRGQKTSWQEKIEAAAGF